MTKVQKISPGNASNIRSDLISHWPPMTFHRPPLTSHVFPYWPPMTSHVFPLTFQWPPMTSNDIPWPPMTCHWPPMTSHVLPLTLRKCLKTWKGETMALSHTSDKITWWRKRKAVLQFWKALKHVKMKKRTICHQRKSLKTFPRSEYSICLSLEQRITKQIHLLCFGKTKNKTNLFAFFSWGLCNFVCAQKYSLTTRVSKGKS